MLKETIKNSIFMACLFLGLFRLYDVSKTVMGFDWRVDLVLSFTLILLGVVYMLRGVR